MDCDLSSVIFYLLLLLQDECYVLSIDIITRRVQEDPIFRLHLFEAKVSASSEKRNLH